MGRYLVPSLRHAVFARDDYRCKKCGFRSPDGTDLTCNHVVPHSKRGPDTIENLDTLCGMCHAELSWVWLDEPPVPYAEWLKIVPAAVLIRQLLLVRGDDAADLTGFDPDVARSAIEGATGITHDVARRLLKRGS